MHKTKDRVTRTPLKTGGELRCSGRVSSSCSTSDPRHDTVKRYKQTNKCFIVNQDAHNEQYNQ